MKPKIEDLVLVDRWILVSEPIDKDSKIVKLESNEMSSEWLEVLGVADDCVFTKKGDMVRLDQTASQIIQQVIVEEDRKVGLVRETFVTATLK